MKVWEGKSFAEGRKVKKGNGNNNNNNKSV